MSDKRIIYNFKNGCLNHYVYEDGTVKCGLRPESEWGPEVDRTQKVDEKEFLDFVDDFYKRRLERKWEKYNENWHHPMRAPLLIPTVDEEMTAFISLVFLFGDKIDWEDKPIPKNLEYFGKGKKLLKKNPFWKKGVRM